jgi:hypothetical protein
MASKMVRRSLSLAGLLAGCAFPCEARADDSTPASGNAPVPTIKGLTGEISDVRTVVEHSPAIADLSAGMPHSDIDLKRMAEWSMHYLARTPRMEFDYEPVFQCFPLRCPPVPKGRDVVVPCDTDARMNWEWYYMREVSGSQADKDIEEAFHKRLLAYVQEDGTVLSHPGCFKDRFHSS